jgi:hypothetical protein
MVHPLDLNLVGYLVPNGYLIIKKKKPELNPPEYMWQVKSLCVIIVMHIGNW